MRRTSRRYWALAIGTAGLAGYVDAIGYLRLRGLFVSFMSGNTMLVSMALARGGIDGALLPAALIGAFVLGVMLGSGVGKAARSWSAPAVLVTVSLLLAGSCALLRHELLVLLLLAAAMGAVNTVFQRDGEVSVGVTYMTGTLVKLGQHASAALTGGPRLDWLPYLLLWGGLMIGAVAGVVSHARLGAASMPVAASMATVLALSAAILRGTGRPKAHGRRRGAPGQ